MEHSIDVYQLLQSDLLIPPNGGHQQALKRSFMDPNEVTLKNLACIRYISLLGESKPSNSMLPFLGYLILFSENAKQN